MSPEPASLRWWGSVTLEEDDLRFWQIGPFKLWASRSAGEWRIVTERSADPLENAISIAVPSPPVEPGAGAVIRRYGFKRTDGSLRLSPLPADRPVVARPETPFSLAPGQEMAVYVSSPLWIGVAAGKPPIVLREEATYRPSDTWFGPSTMEGELGYAVRTAARLSLAEIPVRPHRAVSAVRIRNRAKGLLDLEKLKLPMRNLSVFGSADGRLWTEAVTLSREEDGDFAALRLEKGPPPDAAGSTLITGPRDRPTRGLLIRAFGGVFGIS